MSGLLNGPSVETIFQPFQYQSSRHCTVDRQRHTAFNSAPVVEKLLTNHQNRWIENSTKTLQQKTVTHDQSGQKRRFCFVFRCYVMFFKTYKTVSTTENDTKERFVNCAICSQFGVDLTNRLTRLPTIYSFVLINYLIRNSRA